MAEGDLGHGLAVLDGRTRLARAALLTFIAVSAADFVITLGEFGGVVDLTADEVSLAGWLATLVYLAYFLVLIASAIVVAMWIHRAHANLRASSLEGLEFSPGWAVGWYFVPIANLFKPFQAMRELWANSLAYRDSFGQEADHRLRLWWGAWIVGNILSNVSARLTLSAGAQAAAMGNLIDLVSTVLLAAASWFLIQIIDTINAGQRSGATMLETFA